MVAVKIKPVPFGNDSTNTDTNLTIRSYNGISYWIKSLWSMTGASTWNQLFVKYVHNFTLRSAHVIVALFWIKMSYSNYSLIDINKIKITPNFTTTIQYIKTELFPQPIITELSIFSHCFMKNIVKWCPSLPTYIIFYTIIEQTEHSPGNDTSRCYVSSGFEKCLCCVYPLLNCTDNSV